MTITPFSFPSFSDTSPSSSTPSGNGGGVGESDHGRASGPSAEEGEVAGKTHLVLVRPDMCRGFIGRSGGTKICLDTACETPSHKADTIKVEREGLVLIKVPKRNQAFSTPSLPVDRLPLGFRLEALEDTLRPAEALRAVIASQVEERDVPHGLDLLGDDFQLGNTGLSETPKRRTRVTHHPSVRVYQGMDADTAYTQASKAIRTPAKLEKTFTDDGGRTLFPTPSRGLESLGTLEDFVTKATGRADVALGDPKEQEAILRELLAELDVVGAAALEVGNAHKDLHTKAHAAVDAIDERFLRTRQGMTLLSASVGDPPHSFQGATVWSALAEVNASSLSEQDMERELSLLDHRLRQLIEHEKENVKRESTLEVAGLEDRFKATIEFVGEQFKNLMDSVKSATARGATIPKDDSSTRMANMGGYRDRYTSPGGSKNHLAGLEARLHALETLQASSKASHPSIPAAPSGLDARLLAVEAALASQQTAGQVGSPQLAALEAALTQKLADQDAKMKGMERRVSGDKVFRSDADGSFNCLEDVLQMVQRNQGFSRISGFLDITSIFVIMDRPAVSGQEHANRLLSSSKVGRGAADSEAMASLTHERPPILFGSTADPGSVKVVSRTAGFGVRLKTFADYDENVNGMKEIMSTMVEDLVTTLTADLDITQEWDRVQACMIRKSTHQALRLLSFITNMYRTLTTTCKYPAGPAWTLIGRIVGVIFITLKSVRARASGLEDIRSDSAKASFIWTMMQSTMLMQEIIDRGFQSHPVVMKEVMEFQLENRVDGSQLEALATEMKSLKNQLKEMQTMVNKSDRASAAATEKLSKINQELGNLKTEVKKLQAKVG